ncbi:unnamed protein product [Mucor hiemalis]
MIVSDSENENITVEGVDELTSVDLLQTPEHIEERVKEYKRQEKARYLLENPNAKMRNNLGHQMNAHLCRLLNPTEYNLSYALPPAATQNVLNQQQASLIIDKICPKFIESVAIMEKYWFMTTSFSIFLHQKDLDDCADGSRVGTQSEAIAFIRAYYSFCSKITPFFGSALQNLPKDITSSVNTIISEGLFLPQTTKSYDSGARVLNQYVKEHSPKQWMFTSKKFKDKGYGPTHPLTSKFVNPTSSVASLILNAYVYKRLDRQQLDEGSKMMKKKKLVTKAAKLVLKYDEDFQKQEELDFEPEKRVELKKDMLMIYEGCIAGQLKSMNMKLFQKAKEEYERNMLNLFEDNDEDGDEHSDKE